ncbi:MAG: lytic transglycosylase F [Desulfobacteraceae bacterium]|jgi:membrane-bound lytic murein transglycosylase MltF|nr:lytic transglycosylase F [Desulfobacteraceae bacterium]
MVNQNESFFIFKVALCVICLIFLSIPAHSYGQADVSNDEPSRKTILKLDQKWTGDFDGMVERRMIRSLVTFSKTNYYQDRGHHRGVTYELLKEFEKTINKALKRKHLKVHVVFIPVTRDQLIPALVEGLGDIAAAALIITPERRKVVDFANPLLKGVDEIVVTGANAPKLSGLDDLSGKEIYVRKSSSYYERLVRLNESFKKAGKPQIILKPADEYLEDEDLLEMVNAGLIPMIVMNSYFAEFWSQIFKDIIIYPKIAVNTGGEISWMIRKDSPKLKRAINDFVKGHKKGTLFGNIMFKRYLKSTKFVRNSLSDEDLERFQAAVEFFKKYSEKYHFDYLLVGALAYQESRIDQSQRSQAGAVGVMQLLPSTAAGHPINIPDIEDLENNINAGVKYLRWIWDTYFENENMDRLNKGLFSIASYNAGPAKIKRLRKEAKDMGLNPNIWFRNVEVVAAKRIGRETVQYVSNIYKYYVSYRLITEKKRIKEDVK